MIKIIHTLDVSAASGLVCHDDHFFVISDDENFLLEIYPGGQMKRHTLIEGKLPEDSKSRKKLKSDFESLAIYESLILAVPSGSKPNRMTCASYDLKSNKVTLVDLTSLYTELLKTFSELNIEGSFFKDDDLYLFQRGNGKEAKNGIIIVDWKSLQIKSIKLIDLGFLKNVPLGFTDACLYENSIYFLAVAEDTESTYDDGSFIGAVIGTMDLSLNILSLRPIAIQHKPEGIWKTANKTFLVTDADNRQIPSNILEISEL